MKQKPAVDRICVGIPPGEVKLSSLSVGTYVVCLGGLQGLSSRVLEVLANEGGKLYLNGGGRWSPTLTALCGLEDIGGIASSLDPLGSLREALQASALGSGSQAKVENLHPGPFRHTQPSFLLLACSDPARYTRVVPYFI